MKTTIEEYLDLDVVNVYEKDKNIMEYNEQIEAELIKEAKNGYPYEIAGFVLGSKKNGEEVISSIYPVENVAKEQERRFEIHGLDYLKVETHALNLGLDVLGIYHSHPDYPAIPSKHDLKFAQEVFSYLIVSVDAAGFTLINSWKKQNKKFIQQDISITK
jgi:proteasome lid subunit RPN8/RPN11